MNQESIMKQEQQNPNMDRGLAPGFSHFMANMAWWILFGISGLFGLYALGMGGLEVMDRLGWAVHAPPRAVPEAFIFHALAGGLALIIGPLQFRRSILTRWPALHRILGRIYVGSIWLASLSGLWSALFFTQNRAAQLAFGLVAVLWFAATTTALLRARAGRLKSHREWMVRSFALSFFFVTFPFWVEGMAATALPHEASYALGVFLGWSLNLAAAELWIYSSRKGARKFLKGLH